MKCLVKKRPEPGLWLDERPIPTIRKREVLIKIRKVSICGTDVHIYKWDHWAQKTVPTPLIIGHEFVGEIVETGEDVSLFKVGDRVTGEGHITCGRSPGCQNGKRHLCSSCQGVGYHRTGCFAEYFALPEENVFRLPDSVPDDVAAIFDPFGNAVHTALSVPLTGEDVLITGAGPIGIMAAAIARHAGARSVIITDVNEYRLELARSMGATAAVNVANQDLLSLLPSMGIPHGCTVGMEMSGSPQAFTSLLRAMQHGGNVALLGIFPGEVAVDWDLVIFKMLVLRGIYGREIFSTWRQMTRLLESGFSLSPVITHRLSFDDFEQGFEVMLSGHAGKVVLDLN